jgi:type VI secretion system protein ImpI/type VI secretion system protein
MHGASLSGLAHSDPLWHVRPAKYPLVGSGNEQRQMTLTLSMLRCPDRVAPATRELQGGEFSIGRGSENDWVLPDPERFLSKRHCLLAYRSGGWQIADLSTNGTFLNHDTAAIGHGAPRGLRDGDRLRLGEYEIEIRITEEAVRYGAADPFVSDPFAPAGSAGRFFGQDPLLRVEPEKAPLSPVGLLPSVSLPHDVDPLAPDPAGFGFPGPVHADHSPHLEDAIRLAPLARTPLPDDWDHDPILDHGGAMAAATEPAPTAQAAEAVSPPRPAAPVSSAPAPASRSQDDLLAAFLRGTGLPDARPADPAAAMEALGSAFRALVSGMRMALIARTAIKREFRIEQTMIRKRGNNPLKFSADDDDALRALLGAGRQTEMGPAEAVDDALRDIRRHELAMMSAMQTAMQALLSRFDPAKLRLTSERSGLNLMPLQKKARAWDAYEMLYAQINQALSDDFDDVFGKAFARAYEQALTQSRERQTEP